MLALDSERAQAADQAAIEASPEVAPPQAEAEAAAELFSAGVIPEVVPEVAAVAEPGSVAPGLTASEQAFGAGPKAISAQTDTGMHHPDDYRAACLAEGTPGKWDDRYVQGHTGAKQWIQPYEGRYDMAFELKQGQSASQAVKDFITGPTIVDYRVIGVAIEMDELRQELGDHRFDALFGSDGVRDELIPKAHRLKITADMYTIPFWEQMMDIADGTDVAKPSEPEAPAIAASVEETPQQVAELERPAPEAIAEELGVRRDQELV